MLAMVLQNGGGHLQQCISVRVLSKTACFGKRSELQPGDLEMDSVVFALAAKISVNDQCRARSVSILGV